MTIYIFSFTVLFTLSMSFLRLDENQSFIVCNSNSLKEGRRIEKDTANTHFFVKDPSLYSSEFLNFWKGRFSSVIIEGDSIIVDSLYDQAVVIPTFLPINKQVEYFSMKDGCNYMLIVKRLNYTEIKYELIELLKGKELILIQSVADLEGAFYLGMEGVFEHQGEVYSMNDYNDSTDSTFTTLMIGDGSLEEANFILVYNDASSDYLRLNLKLKK